MLNQVLHDFLTSWLSLAKPQVMVPSSIPEDSKTSEFVARSLKPASSTFDLPELFVAQPRLLELLDLA